MTTQVHEQFSVQVSPSGKQSSLLWQATVESRQLRMKYNLLSYNYGTLEQLVADLQFGLDVLTTPPEKLLESPLWGDGYYPESNKAETLSKVATMLKDSMENVLKNSVSAQKPLPWNDLKDVPILEEPKKTDKNYAVGEKPQPDDFITWDETQRCTKRNWDSTTLTQREVSYKSYISKWSEENKYSLERWKKESLAKGLAFKTDLEKWQKYQAAYTEYFGDAVDYLVVKQSHNAFIDEMASLWQSGAPEAISFYYTHILSAMELPDCVQNKFTLLYDSATKTLGLDYYLPTLESLPTIKEYKYIESRDELIAKKHPETFIKKLYNDLIYQVALAIVYTIAKADTPDNIASVVFNGFIETRDKATGKEVSPCIVSLHVTKNEILSVDLMYVDPKECFKKLKGVACTKLETVTPVRPILDLNKSDKRFVEGYNVLEATDSGTNLAAMDWQDFEHLIREIFEKEFK